jgi:hypothetical protein
MSREHWRAGDSCEAQRSIWLPEPKVEIERGAVGTVRYVDPGTQAIVVEWPIGHFVRFTAAQTGEHLRRIAPTAARG